MFTEGSFFFLMKQIIQTNKHYEKDIQFIARA